MPYIGPPAPDRFVAPKAAKQFSGDGSTTAFTLDHAVGSDEDILVSVDGVIQEPSVAYAVSNGTTLTFTAAPSSNSGNNIFVYYLFRTVGTVGHPSNQALTATTGTFTGDVNVTGNVISNDGSNTARFQFDNDNQMLIINDTDMRFLVGGNTNLKIDANGHVTKPLQSAFMAYANEQADIAVGSNVNVVFANERFDQNADFDGTSTFTAPVTGRYQLNASIYLLGVDTAAAYYYLELQTSNELYYNIIDTTEFNADLNYWTFTLIHLVDMDASDTAVCRILQANGTSQTHINANSFFSGYLVC